MTRPCALHSNGPHLEGDGMGNLAEIIRRLGAPGFPCTRERSTKAHSSAPATSDCAVWRACLP